MGEVRLVFYKTRIRKTYLFLKSTLCQIIKTNIHVISPKTGTDGVYNIPVIG